MRLAASAGRGLRLGFGGASLGPLRLLLLRRLDGRVGGPRRRRLRAAAGRLSPLRRGLLRLLLLRRLLGRPVRLASAVTLSFRVC